MWPLGSMTLALLSSLLDRLSGVVWWQLALALLCCLVVQALRAKAWEQVLQIDAPQLEVSYPKIAAAYAAGAGANAFIPAHGGDLVRLFLAKRAVRGASYPTLAASVLVLIAVDTVVAMAFVLWGVVWGPLPSPSRLVGDNRVGHLAVAHPALFVLVVGLSLAALAVLVRFLLARLERRLAHRAADLRRGFASCKDPRLVTRVLPWQLAAWLMQLPCYWLFLEAFAVHPSVYRAATVQAASGLAVALPIAGGSLASQAILVASFHGSVGAARTLAFFVGMRFAVAVLNVALAAIALLATLHTLDVKDILASARAARSPVVGQPAVLPLAVDEEPQA